MTNNRLKRLILPAIFALVIAYGMGYLMLKGAGLRHAFFYTMPLVLLYALCSGSRKVFWFFLFPFTLIYALYAPIGFTYGKLSYDFFIAGISTDMIEIKEFAQLIPLRNFFLPVLILILLFLFWKIVRRYQIYYYRNKTFLFISLLIITIGQSPMIFLQQIREGSTTYYKEQQALNNLVEANEWGESLLVNSQYDTYILVVGESAQKGYHHAYGYPINTTPFMSTANGILVDGLIAGGTSTVPSLKAMLTLSDKTTWDADYTKTIVGLAQSAGIKTYWLSNQGYFGTFDTPISALATSSDEKKFMKFGDYGTANTSDFELLKYLEEIVENAPHEKKLIVVHLYGSHANACQRIEDYALIHEVKDSRYDYINCYITSLHKTDTLLREINDFMNQISQKDASSYSLLYFSDHGQTLYETDGQYFLGNRGGYNQYEIPLFMTASDIQTRTECQSFKSGINFTNGLASWMGIQNPLLDHQYSLFNCQDDPDDYGLSKKLEGLQRDEVVVLELE